MGSSLRGFSRPLFVLTLLAGCAADPVPEPTQPIVLQPSITEVSPPKPVIKQPMTAAWSFDGEGDTCRATAASPGATLDLTADRNAAVISLRYKAGVLRGAVPLRLSGPAGSWNLFGRATGRAVRATRAMDEEAASRLLVLLSGGTLTAGRAEALNVPSAGAAGNSWFDCVRRQLLP